MRKSKHSGSSLFLLEIMINILIFTALLCVCLQIFVKAHRLTRETTQLQRAVTSCANAASVFECGDGSLDSILKTYSYSTAAGGQAIVYLDEDFLECSKEHAVYTMQILPLVPKSDTQVKMISITCFYDNEEIYSITACNYTPLTPSSSGGNNYE